jgi:adenine-specific DNA-methyltransferase
MGSPKTKRGDDWLLRFAAPCASLWKDFGAFPSPESALVSAAVALGADRLGALSDEELALVRRLNWGEQVGKSSLSTLRELIFSGFDPLGEAFCALRPPAERRKDGATYTPSNIVGAMVQWAATKGKPSRIVDPGAGSARFLMSAGRLFASADLTGVESDPLAALLARANLNVLGFADRARILVGDYRRFSERSAGTTLYIGNPPYVRHHDIDSGWKEWFFNEAAELGYRASKLAGLHVHFFLATARHAREGDFGAFITAAEWLDVNYGSLVRSLMMKELGGQSITLIEPTARPFSDALTTAAIATFQVGDRPSSVFFRRVDNLRTLAGLDGGRRVHRDRLVSHAAWSALLDSSGEPREGFVQLGELCRVHRGQVTGSNHVWIAGSHSQDLPASVLFPAVTRAREVIAARGVLDDPTKLRCVIDLPIDLDVLSLPERIVVNRFLRRAREMGANLGYVASHRKAWWAVELRPAAPVISTYMARRPPAFVVNRAGARHINIAHGLYPRIPLSNRAQVTLVRYLQSNISQRSGRTYGGGLTKFEPREMERLLVPGPEMLESGVMQ